MGMRLVRTKGNNAVNIMRGTRWCNPFVVGKDGSAVRVLQLFEEYMIWRIGIQSEWLKPLQKKNLYCSCEEREYCHGNVLLKYIMLKCPHCHDEVENIELLHCSECNEDLCFDCFSEEGHDEHV